MNDIYISFRDEVAGHSTGGFSSNEAVAAGLSTEGEMSFKKENEALLKTMREEGCSEEMISEMAEMFKKTDSEA